jgi:glycosidase
LFLCACSQAPENGMISVATPIQFQNDSSLVYLEDYFVNPSQIDSIETDLEYYWDRTNSKIKFVENPTSTMANLRFWIGGGSYDIPVFKSEKQAVSFSLNLQTETQVSIFGSFNGWVPEAMSFQEGTYSKTLLLGDGSHQYLFQIDGQNTLDPNNSDSISNGMGAFNSILSIGDNTKYFRLETAHFDEHAIYVKCFGDCESVLAYADNHQLKTSVENEFIKIDLSQVNTKRDCIRVWATSGDAISNDLLIPLNNGRVLVNPNLLERSNKHAMQLYFLMVDRFNNGTTKNDYPVADKAIQPIANYMGGDFTGITAKIKSGYFASLGMNTLWLSPITQNPKDAWGLWNKGGQESEFSGYHGYWPISTTQIDERFGSELEFVELIDEAHKHGINILIDHVANHVHQDHPIYQNNKDWATPLYLEDGRMNTEMWDEQRLTTWFDSFLPTLDFSKKEVVEAMTDSALFWFENYDIDGFRHDATKHVHIDFWRTLTRKINERVVVPNNRNIYQVGETYGSPELIASYVKTGLLDGQFDFNIYDAAVHAFVNEHGDISRLLAVLKESLKSYGSHHLMANITGNQDKVRFMSYADGSVAFDEDPKKAGWSRAIELQDTLAYKRLQNLAAFTFFIPGIPVIYYADEIGDVGAGDPDNRRMMRFENVSVNESQTREVFSRLAKYRKENMALLFGDTRIVYQDENSFVLSRKYFDEETLLLVNNSNQQKQFDIEISSELHSAFIKKQADLLTLAPCSFNLLSNK